MRSQAGKTVIASFVGPICGTQNKIEKRGVASRFVTLRHPSLHKKYVFGGVRFPALTAASNIMTPAGHWPEMVPRTKEGRPALDQHIIGDSTSWMPAGRTDRSSLTFADVPAYTHFNRQGEQQWRL
jgi:hypothetical protein